MHIHMCFMHTELLCGPTTKLQPRAEREAGGNGAVLRLRRDAKMALIPRVGLEAAVGVLGLR
jgi:hypothetical protein